MLTGLLGALTAAIAYGAATILQAIGVQRMAAVGAGASAWQRLVAGRLYAVGLGLDGLGFLASVAALRTLPLFLVESAVASSVAITAVLAVLVLHVRLRRAEVSALGVTSLGLVVLAVSAEAGPGRRVGSAAGWLLLGSAALVGLLLFAGMRARDDLRGSALLAAAAGLGFGLVGIAARTLHVHHPWWPTLADPVLWAIAVHGVLATAAYGLALHRGRTTTVAAITFAVETVFPTVIGIAFLGDGVRAHFFPVAALGFLATLGGSVTLAGFAETPAEGDVRPGLTPGTESA